MTEKSYIADGVEVVKVPVNMIHAAARMMIEGMSRYDATGTLGLLFRQPHQIDQIQGAVEIACDRVYRGDRATDWIAYSKAWEVDEAMLIILEDGSEAVLDRVDIEKDYRLSINEEYM